MSPSSSLSAIQFNSADICPNKRQQIGEALIQYGIKFAKMGERTQNEGVTQFKKIENTLGIIFKTTDPDGVSHVDFTLTFASMRGGQKKCCKLIRRPGHEDVWLDCEKGHMDEIVKLMQSCLKSSSAPDLVLRCKLRAARGQKPTDTLKP